MAVLAFLQLSTKPEVFTRPLTAVEACGVMDSWLAQPSGRVLSPTARHAELLTTLLGDLGTGGNLVNDAHLAALAIEHRAEIITFDRDFGRFPGVRWSEPS